MIVLYCNPSFWEYRLPFYVELNKLFKGQFHVIYSTKRYAYGHQNLLNKIKEELGNNAHPYDNELMFDVKSKSFNKFTEGGKQIPLPIHLWKKISEINPDVIITEGFFQWTPWIQLWAFFHHIPVFMGYERTLHTERNNSKLKTWLRKIQNKFIKGYLVNGSETKKYLESIGVAPTKIFIGGMSADSKGLKESIATFPQSERNSFRLKYKRGNNGIIYLFSGRVEKLKGTPQLLAAWEQHIKKYPDDSIVLIGYGESYDVLKEKYKMDKSIFLEGRINYDEVYKYYAIADVFILPTLQDNWSLVIPEAMSCGLPVATSIYNGCHSELIHKDKNGITFDTFKQDSLIQALDYFHHHDLKEMGHQSILLEKPFNTKNCAKREYEAIINNI
jgi:glycosyltransferase involved in cell wall biosynthesis